VKLLHVLAVIAFAVRQPEEPLFQDRVVRVPQRESEAQALLVIREAGDAILTPSIRTTARVIVREVFPGIAVRAVVLTDRAPLALGEIRAPFLPAFAGGEGGGQSVGVG